MAKIDVTTDLGTKSLYFGMTGVQLWQRKCAEELVRLATPEEIKELPQEELAKRVDNTRSFAFLVYAGLCNAIDLSENGGMKPTFEEAYMFGESMTEAQQLDVYAVFEGSRAHKQLLDSLPKPETGKKKAPKK